MVGVGGVGMAGVALLLRARGLPVSGCDAARGALAASLEAAGIAFLEGQAAGHIAGSGVDWVVRTPAVREDCDELAAARAAGLPVFRRGEVLPALLAEYGCSVAVAGTHGKTTTTTLITQILRAAGRDPSWCIGGESVPLGAVAHAGAGGVMVVEADESDGTLALYRPDIAVVTNVEFDHMEHFESVEAFEACFATFMASAGRRVVYCGDDPRARRLGAAAANGLRYGFSPESALRGALAEDGRTMRVYREGALLGELPLILPGTHNALNLLAATAVCLELGLPFAEVAAVAGSALALPRRRYETIGDRDGIRVISDYAHHPTEIAALVQTARREHAGRLLAVFQPHRYTRTAALGADFPAAFAGVDLLVLTPVYAASEPPLEGGMACDLYAHFRALAGGAVPQPLLATSLEQAWAFLRREWRDGDWLLVIGAGDVEKIAQWARTAMEADEAAPPGVVPRLAGGGGLELSPASAVRENEPLGRRTTYGVGGRADCWVEAGSEEDASRVLRYCRRHDLPLRILGAGSNMLVSDLGVRGVVMRLTGVVFQGIRLEGEAVMAGGAVPLVRLQEQLTEAGLSGLEFLEGVPGGVGGIVRMNGGAYGHEVRERILWIRGLNRDGEPCIVQADALEWGYRGCESVRDLIVLEAGFRLVPGDPADILARRQEIAVRRAWMNGLRCAGSVFRNPPGAYAGKLVEAAGLKGMRIGGAVIYPRHGNFVVADAEACASDVLALIHRMESAVRRSSGVELVREVVCLE
jgi:UDP-N-acetylmuramate--L-alanine ligase/UDP-N-acetylenolpyruvoylglucosamine reductase